MKRQTKAEREMDRTIERLYATHAQGRTINVLDIPRLYRDVKKNHAEGIDLETAVRAAVIVYTQPA